MNCSGVLTAACRSDESRPYRGLNGIVRLCDVCHAVALRMGMSLAPVPEWIARAQAHVLPPKVWA